MYCSSSRSFFWNGDRVEYIDLKRGRYSWEVAAPASILMSPVLPTITSSSHTYLLLKLREEDSSSDDSPPSASGLRSPSLSHISPSSTWPQPTHPVEDEKDAGYEYVTLSITLPYTTYLTTILLGDSFPTTDANTLVPTTYAVPTSSSNTRVQTPGISTGAIVGIVVGLIVGFSALLGVFYVYLLRAREAKRRRRRRRSRRGSSATADGEWI